MPKNKTSYVCSVCGSLTAKWYGQCPDCGSWNTIEEAAPELAPKTAAAAGDKPQKQRGGTGAEPVPFSMIESGQQIYQPTGLSELDRVLGGGLVEGGLLLFGGEPGIGKSTLLLQVCANLSRLKKRVLYITGEESARQVKLRAERLGADSSDVEAFVQHIGKEILVPNDLVGKAKKWLDFLRYCADSNETNGTYKFPLNTVKDMAFALLVFKPRRIEADQNQLLQQQDRVLHQPRGIVDNPLLRQL